MRFAHRAAVGTDAGESTCMAELRVFERDLHRHVHLENNILFPKAIALENGSWRRDAG